MENEAYLEPGFDPTSLKVAQLRGVLLAHDIDYPSSAKKADLVGLFKKEVLPKAAALLAKHKSVNASDQGIINFDGRKPKDLIVSDASPKSSKKPKRLAKPSKLPTDLDAEVVPSRTRRSLTSVSHSLPVHDSDGDLDIQEVVKTSPKKPTQTVGTDESVEDIHSSDIEEISKQDPAKLKFATSNKSKAVKTKKVGKPVATKVEKKKRDTKTKEAVNLKELTAHIMKGRVLDIPKPKDEDTKSHFSSNNVFQSSSNTSPAKTHSADTSFEAAIANAVRSPKRVTVKDARHKDSNAGPKRNPSLDTDSKIKKNSSAISNKKLVSAVESNAKKVLQAIETSAKKLVAVAPTNQSNLVPVTPSSKISTLVKKVASSGKKTSGVRSPSVKTTPLKSASKKLPVSEREVSHHDVVSSPTIRVVHAALPTVADFSSQDFAAQLGVTLQGTPKESTPVKRKVVRAPTLSEVTDNTDYEIFEVSKLLSQPRIQDEELSDEEVELDTEENTKADIKAKGQRLRVSVKETPDPKPTSFLKILNYILVWFLLLLAGVYGAWYRDQRILVGYCGAEIYQRTFENPTGNLILEQLESFLDSNKPQCRPCPSNGRCTVNFQLQCYDDFVESYPWYSFNGLVPVAGKCVPDTKKAERIDRIIDFSLQLLRERNANADCGDCEDDLDAGFTTEALRDIVYQLKADYISPEDFDDIWNRALFELEKEPEIKTRYLGDYSQQGPKETSLDDEPSSEESQNKVLRTTSLANLSLQCKFKRAVVNSLARYRLPLGILAAALLIVKVLQKRHETKRVEHDRIQKLNSLILQKLQAQRHLAVSDRNGFTKPYIGSIQLRDLLLSEENSTKKMKIWESVSRKVEYNTCIRSHMMEVHGEIMKVWEWIANTE
ncbi:hypothetical protein BABINDRAFT_163792 [Babjeviella inositovora NRRL Y-12698]|uniref:Inner nuclear membrane protein SRC1 n=1 Tax=Babjeviella inositovora NRRL Y-12698 TaxID=984486 RepID=A0A1E3QH85_9ASCO|nr:uncharacterized protein BABINDRAFT_163792 [Babjeviella inositovora NRRL Y-12698]ODQ77059.1 hypothetical protein BABINDRAFT_163792 [Babjeviella inositovora NRRL Y-12698]